VRPILFENAHVLDCDGGIERRQIAVVGDRISGSSTDVPQWRIDCRGALIAPGLVDIHGDSFERHLMPRPGAHFEPTIGVLDNDKALAANGITTAYLGISISWEPGLRGTQTGLGFIKSIALLRDRLVTDTKIHVRLEMHNVDAFDRVAELARTGNVDLVMLNDHLSQHERRLKFEPEREAHWAALAGMSVREFGSLIGRVRESAADTADLLVDLLAVLRTLGISYGSHDDETPAERERYHALGAEIAEFPCNLETAQRAKMLGNSVVMGGPNVVRGGSANGNIPATAVIDSGSRTILASDYYYPSLLHAPFALARQGKMPLAQAWALVSTNPARALGLTDRGDLKPGKRADLIVIADWQARVPQVAATFSRGMPVYFSRELCANSMVPTRGFRR
jgi:alpha-D-ribose 1-methylphosphonate 5-triphosphate diphosphatase